jgi:hypothetical protein
VNVQLEVLLPPLEQAPDQIASRPFETVSRTDVPTANVADPVLPVATLMPDGLERTRSPPRPLAVTVNVAVCGGGGSDAGGMTVSVALFVTPFSVAAIVTPVEALTPDVVMANTALCEPAGTVTLAGTPAVAGWLLDNATVVAVVAAAESTTAPCAFEPPVTLDGFTTKFVSVLVDDPAGLIVRLAERVPPL